MNPPPNPEAPKSTRRSTNTWRRRGGCVRIPLCEVLSILKYRVHYHEDRFDFHHSITGNFVFSTPRTAEHRNVWDVLHASGVFDNPNFAIKAQAYMRRNPIKER